MIAAGSLSCQSSPLRAASKLSPGRAWAKFPAPRRQQINSCQLARQFSSSTPRPSAQPSRVAVLYQELEPPVIDGTKKPKKPGGYKDSGADIAFNLSACEGVQAVTPAPRPDPTREAGWVFPDHEDGILEAIDRGATHLWANTIVFASHPLQTSAAIARHAGRVRVVGQGPLCVEKYDNKEYVNDLLRRVGGFTMPRSWPVSEPTADVDVAAVVKSVTTYPAVAKPARGRGSYGVKVCRDEAQLAAHLEKLKGEGLTVIVEEFLGGEEATVTVMPPKTRGGDYWSLPVVTRFNHDDGIAPYNGVVAVTANSRAVVGSSDPAYERVMRECEQAAKLLGTTAPIRVDVRRFKAGSEFALFDVNMKPNMTGPGRPGRDDQASLSLLAAQALGWDYKEFLRQILRTASPLDVLKSRIPK